MVVAVAGRADRGDCAGLGEALGVAHGWTPRRPLPASGRKQPDQLRQGVNPAAVGNIITDLTAATVPGGPR